MTDDPLDNTNILLGGRGGTDEDYDGKGNDKDDSSPSDGAGGEDSDASLSGEEKEKPSKKESRKEASASKQAPASKRKLNDGDEDGGKKKKPKRKKDPVAPKKAMTGNSGFKFCSPTERGRFKKSRKTYGHGTTLAGVSLDTFPAIIIGGDGFETDSNLKFLRSDKDVKVVQIHDMICALEGDTDLTNLCLEYIRKKVERHIRVYNVRQSVEQCANMVRQCYLQKLFDIGEEEDREGIEGMKGVHGSIMIGGFDNGRPQLWVGNRVGARKASKYCFAGSGGEYAEVSIRNKCRTSNDIEEITESFEEGFLGASHLDSHTGGRVTIAIIEPRKLTAYQIDMKDLMIKHRKYFREVKLFEVYDPELDAESLCEFTENEKRVKRFLMERSSLKHMRFLMNVRFSKNMRLLRMERDIKNEIGEIATKNIRNVVPIIPQREQMLMRFLRPIKILRLVRETKKVIGERDVVPIIPQGELIITRFLKHLRFLRLVKAPQKGAIGLQ